MNIELLRKIIAQYVTLDPNDDFGTEKCWNEMTDILSADISATISFFDRDCTDEEFYWLGSIFEDIAEKTQSKEFIQTLRNRLARGERTPAYRGGSFLLQREQHYSSEELR